MTLPRLLAYGLPALPLAFAALPVYVHVPHYYAARTDLDLGLLGLILLGARLADAVVDPCLGWLADRVSRPWMAALALLPFAGGFAALLHPPAVGAGPWLLAALAVTYLGFSAATVAYQAWGAAVAADSFQRTRLVASREGFGLLGVLLAAALPGLLAADPEDGVARLAWVLPPMLLLAAITAFALVGSDQPPEQRRHPLLSSLRQSLADGVFRRLLAVFIANGIAAALPATLFLFFVADVLQVKSAGGGLLALYFVAGAASLPFWVGIAARRGRVFAWLAGMALSLVAFAGAATLGSGDLWPFAAVCLASGLALGADLAIPAALAADLGQRQGRPGAVFGIWNLVAKLNLALAAGLALPLLGVLGYVPGSGAGLPALSFAYAWLPLAFKGLAGVLLWRWRPILEIKP